MRVWWGVGAAIVAIGIAFVADDVIGRLLQEASSRFASRDVLWLLPVARVAFATLIVGLAALVIRGPRSRPAGAGLTVLGFYFGVLPPLALIYLAVPLPQMPPLTSEVMQFSSMTGFVLWVACAVMVLGIVELLWPTAAHARTASSPRELAHGT